MNHVNLKLWEEAVKVLRMLHDRGVNIAVIAIHNGDVRADIMLHHDLDEEKPAVVLDMIRQLAAVQ